MYKFKLDFLFLRHYQLLYIIADDLLSFLRAQIKEYLFSKERK